MGLARYAKAGPASAGTAMGFWWADGRTGVWSGAERPPALGGRGRHLQVGGDLRRWSEDHAGHAPGHCTYKKVAVRLGACAASLQQHHVPQGEVLEAFPGKSEQVVWASCIRLIPICRGCRDRSPRVQSQLQPMSDP